MREVEKEVEMGACREWSGIYQMRVEGCLLWVFVAVGWQEEEDGWMEEE